MDSFAPVLIVLVIAITVWLIGRRIRTVRQLMGLAKTIEHEGPGAAAERTRELEEDASKGLTE